MNQVKTLANKYKNYRNKSACREVPYPNPNPNPNLSLNLNIESRGNKHSLQRRYKKLQNRSRQ